MKRILLPIAMLLAAGSACLGSTVKPDPTALTQASANFPYDAWNELLQKYVDTMGRVNYAALKADAADLAKLEKIYASAGMWKPEGKSKNEKEAFYLDAYNVCVWKNVLMRLPKLKNVDSEKASFFFFTKFVVAGKEINLKDLEGDVVRPQFKDGRAHMALNCASGGCPQLPNYAFTPPKLDDQLNKEARKFVNEKRNVDLDPATKKLRLSHIFDWYKEDFGKDPAKVIAWINHFRAADAQLPADAKIEYVDYDWSLNDPTLKR